MSRDRRNKRISKTYCPDAKDTKAICPKCSKVHYVYINYTGRGTLKLFCPKCRQLSDGRYNLINR